MGNNILKNTGEKQEASRVHEPREHEPLLRVRARQKKKKPHFARQESWRYKRLSTSWRRPKGIDSAMRLKRHGRPKSVNVGYRSPRLVRGFHPSGFEEKLVHTLRDLENVNQKQVIRIGHTVGRVKRLKIIERARELGLHVLNKRGVDLDELEESEKTSS